MTNGNQTIEIAVRHAVVGGFVVAAGLLSTGCDFPPRPPIAAPKSTSIAEVNKGTNAETAGLEPPQIAFAQDWEAWDAYFLNDRQVGYSHIIAERMSENAIGRAVDPNVQYTLEDQIRIRRGKASYVQHLRQRSTETSIGALLDFDATLQIGPLVKQFNGTVEENNLRIETVQGSSRSSELIPWQSTYRGLVSVQQSLRRKPMKQGERRVLKGLSSIQYQISTVSLYCKGVAAIPLIDGNFSEANEIVGQFRSSDEGAAEQLIWTDDRGEILKTLRSADGLTSYRTDKQTALTGATAADDLLASTGIAVSESLERPSEATRVVYLVRPSPAAIRQQMPVNIAAQPEQFVRDLADGSAEVVVTRGDETPPIGFQQATLTPEQGDIAPSPVIDFQARQIVKYAATAGKGLRRENRDLALELTQLTATLMDRRNVRGFAKASEIASTLEGGAIEHAVLLAALLRAREIPARLAAGFVFQGGDRPQMAFHIWNLAHVDDRWISLDATLGTVAPADRLTLTTTNLSGGKEYDALIPVLEALGRIEIDLRGAEY